VFVDRKVVHTFTTDDKITKPVQGLFRGNEASGLGRDILISMPKRPAKNTFPYHSTILRCHDEDLSGPLESIYSIRFAF
jgi:hypothetical protein